MVGQTVRHPIYGIGVVKEHCKGSFWRVKFDVTRAFMAKTNGLIAVSINVCKGISHG